MRSHPNGRLTERRRHRLLIQHLEEGRSFSELAAENGISVRGSERILFDQGTPVPLRLLLSGHIVATAYELGWSTVTDGDLIRLAEEEGFELLITTDTNLRFQ